MKCVRIYTGANGEAHAEEQSLDFVEYGGTRTAPQPAVSVSFFNRIEGSFIDFHPASRRQYIFYLTARAEIGLRDGSTVVMEPGDVLLAEDTTGHGHTSRILNAGLCAVVPLAD